MNTDKQLVTRTARCSCGKVEIEAYGSPMASTVCYCDTCQEGSHLIEALPGAAHILDEYGGTPYVLYRKDRIKYSKGIDLLKEYKLDPKSATSRVVATCCNSAMIMRFDDARHWVTIYRDRFAGADNASGASPATLPPLEWRICTKFKPAGATIPNDIPSSEMYPAGLGWRLLTAKIAMIFGK